VLRTDRRVTRAKRRYGGDLLPGEPATAILDFMAAQRRHDDDIAGRQQPALPSLPVMHALDSGTLDAAGFDAPHNVLFVSFRDGGPGQDVHRYFGVPHHVFVRLLAAPSPGDYFSAAIRNRYPSEKLL
jgi:hypothetical protein